MANALSDVQATFLSLDAQYNTLRAGCKTPAQRDALAAQYSTAQQNYQSTLNATLADGLAMEARTHFEIADTDQRIISFLSH